MPSHLVPSDPSPPEIVSETPLFPPEVITQAPIIDQFGMMLIVGTIIIAGIFVFIVIRRSRKK